MKRDASRVLGGVLAGEAEKCALVPELSTKNR